MTSDDSLQERAGLLRERVARDGEALRELRRRADEERAWVAAVRAYVRACRQAAALTAHPQALPRPSRRPS